MAVVWVFLFRVMLRRSRVQAAVLARQSNAIIANAARSSTSPLGEVFLSSLYVALLCPP
ncbi:hypothetical protein K2Q00_01650 [Patescibacteria group bacterium]|nr:hypothetical protein [Patescibacteria group bacterium]